MNRNVVTKMIVVGMAAALCAVAPLAVQGAPPPSEPSTPASQAPAKTEPQLETSGRIKAIDQQKQTVTIKGMVLEKTFDVPATASIVVKGNENASLSDLKVGEKASVTYHSEGDKLIAQKIEVGKAKVGEIPVSRSPYVSI